MTRIVLTAQISEYHFEILTIYAQIMRMSKSEAIRRLIEEEDERSHLSLIEPESLRKKRLKGERHEYRLGV